VEELYRHIDLDPAFHALQKRRSRFNWTLTLIMLGVYYSFIGVIAFKPTVLAIPLHDDTVITWGIPVGLAVILISLALTGIYVVRSNRDFDPATKAIIDDALRATGADGAGED
jgi:uncharacterized membrane protein (DUF485 family)